MTVAELIEILKDMPQEAIVESQQDVQDGNISGYTQSYEVDASTVYAYPLVCPRWVNIG